MPDFFCPNCMKTLESNSTICPYCGKSTSIQPPPHHLPIGYVLSDDKEHYFLIGKALGEGGFGITYIAKEFRTDRLVAIKEYYPKRCSVQRTRNQLVIPVTAKEQAYQQGKESFVSEASMLYAVSFIPSCVHVLEFFEKNRTAYMVMEFINGIALSTYVAEKGVMSINEVESWLDRFSADLEQLHNANVIHRDIAPDNLLMMPNGSVKLIDFGCARTMEDGRSMTVMLKPGFAPVEQYQSHGQGPFTDIYSLCATIYYCLTGTQPAASPERLNAVVDGLPDPLLSPGQLGCRMLDTQEQALLTGLTVQPVQRFQTMSEFRRQFFSKPDKLPNSKITIQETYTEKPYPKQNSNQNEVIPATFNLEQESSQGKTISQSPYSGQNIHEYGNITENESFFKKYKTAIICMAGICILSYLFYWFR